MCSRPEVVERGVRHLGGAHFWRSCGESKRVARQMRFQACPRVMPVVKVRPEAVAMMRSAFNCDSVAGSCVQSVAFKYTYLLRAKYLCCEPSSGANVVSDDLARPLTAQKSLSDSLTE